MSKRDMKQWVADVIASPKKASLPVLSFPSVQLMGITVKELISAGEIQAKGMKLVAERTPMAASVSLMDLSVEAEAFGSTVRVSDDEVPTVIGAIVSDEDAADALRVPQVGDGRTGINVDGIRRAAELIQDRPVFAGVIGPFSLAGELRNGTPDSVRAATRRVMESCCRYPNFVISSGCDIPPLTPWENIDAFFGAVEEFYANA